MSDQNTEEEPSIEEILTSIRQIISDDDDEAPEEEAAEEPAPEPEEAPIELTEKVEEPEPEPEPEPEADDDVALIDTDPEPEPDFGAEPEEEAPIEVEMQDPKPSSYEPDDDSDLLTNQAETAAYDAFSELARKTAVEHGGITLEEIVRTELKPLLRDWLDRNLPKIIERLVQEELDRVAKRALED